MLKQLARTSPWVTAGEEQSFFNLSPISSLLSKMEVLRHICPKTFEHALVVARELKVGYIWIDSLCIVPDDPQDWLHESSLMHRIYANSLCNIAATGAADRSDGLFFGRDPGHVNPVRTHILLEGTAEKRRIFKTSEVKSRGLYDISEVEFWKNNVLNAPLNRRGRVCQDSLLAPRILHFGKTQLLWECRKMEAAEKYPKGIPAIMLNKNPNIGLKRRFVDAWINSKQPDHLGMSTDVSGKQPAAFEVWDNIIWAFR